MVQETQRARILIADDQPDVLTALRLLLKSNEMDSTSARSPSEVLDKLSTESFDAVVLDMNYHRDTTSGQEGLELVAKIKKVLPQLPIIALTAWGTIDLAVEAVRRGACDFLPKPWDNQRLLTTLRAQLAPGRENQSTQDPRTDPVLPALVARSAAMWSLVELIERVAPSDTNVLITGENGTGKGVAAREVHARSRRAVRPLLTVNMAAFLESMAKVPGVNSVSASRFPPLAQTGSSTMAAPINEDLSSGDRIEVNMNIVAPGYFGTTGIPLLVGRDFTAGDTRDAKAVIIVNETLARAFGGNEKATGRLLSGGMSESAEIVGVAKNSKYNSLGEEDIPFVYMPFAQSPTTELTFCMRTAGDPEAVLPLIADQIRGMNPDLALSGLRTIEEQTRRTLAPARASAILFGVLGGLALTLAVIGIYGVVSYSVARRKLEIGVRMALGGQPRDLVVLLIKRGLRLVATGAILGVAISFGITRFLAPLLSGLSPTDLQVFVAVPFILLVVAGFAIYLPARGATRVDPMVVLRYE